MARPVTDKRLKKIAKQLAGTKAKQRVAGRSRFSGREGPSTNLLSLPLPGDFPKFWSFSRWTAYRDCGRYYMLDKIKKLVPFQGNSATERGSKIHLLAKQYLLGKVKGLPSELESFKGEFSNLKRAGAIPEKEWVITEDEKHTYGTDWGGAWLRAAIDAHVPPGKDKILFIVDYKTGKLKIDKAQADLYAALSILYYPEAETIQVELWFIDHGHVEPFEYTAKEARALWKKWRERADRMLKDREFKPKPGGKCRYCQYRSDKQVAGQQGPCDGWKDAA